VLAGGLTTFLLSKEYLEFNDELLVMVIFFGVFLRYLGVKNDGQIGRYLDKSTETYENEVRVKCFRDIPGLYNKLSSHKSVWQVEGKNRIYERLLRGQ
jgi:hypothetical protein